MPSRVLLVDDEPNIVTVLSAQLEAEGLATVGAQSAEEALELLETGHFEVVISDLKMDGMDGLSLLREILARDPAMPVVMLTAFGTLETAVQAMKAGAFDFLAKPFDEEELRGVVLKAVRTRELRGGALGGDEVERQITEQLTGSGPETEALLLGIDKAAGTPSTVLITGESGTGKELVAAAIHRRSPRGSGPLVEVQCGAVAPELLAAELFGQEAGSGVAARGERPGRLELADGGSLVLAEIARMPLPAQASLLRVIEGGRFERVGGLRSLRSDVRLIVTSTEDPQAAAQDGRLLEELLYRLKVVQLHVPPLRERREDIPLLTAHFVARCNERLRRQVRGASDEALGLLSRYPWPGNVRELRGAIERAMNYVEGDVILPKDLPPEVQAGKPRPPGDAPDMQTAAREAKEATERAWIERALAETGGNVTHAANKLGLSRKGLQLKMKALGLRDRRGPA